MPLMDRIKVIDFLWVKLLLSRDGLQNPGCADPPVADFLWCCKVSESEWFEIIDFHKVF